MPPKVSIVLTTRNDEKYIEETLKSLVEQNYPNVQIHVQDCLSTDRTLEILQRYGVQYRTEQDEGVPDGFNRGLRATDGEILIFLGGDDPLLPTAVPTLVDALMKNPEAGIVYGDIEFIDASSKPYFYLKGRDLDLDDLFWGNHVPTQAVAMRRSALEAVGGYRTEIICADWDLFLRMGAQFRAVYLPQPLGQYRVHDGSLTLNNLTRFAKSVCWVADTLLDDPKIVSQLKKGRNRALAGSYLISSALFVAGGDRAEGLRRYFAALRAWPRGAFTRAGGAAVLALLLGPKLYYRLRNRGRGRG